jgi:hypothetical protein
LRDCFPLLNAASSAHSEGPAMASEFKHYVFRSHSAKDKAVVRPLAERLRQDERHAKAEARRQKAEILHSAFFLHPSLRAFGSDWAQLETGTCGRGNWWERRLAVRDPLNQERRFIPLRLDVPRDCFGSGRRLRIQGQF